MRIGVAALVLLVASCTRAEEPAPVVTTEKQQQTAVARAFAEAFVADDFETMASYLCPGPIPPEPPSFPFDDARVVGRPSAERPASAVIVEPRADLFVPFVATDNGAQVEGTIEITFGPGNCVENHSVSRDF